MENIENFNKVLCFWRSKILISSKHCVFYQCITWSIFQCITCWSNKASYYMILLIEMLKCLFFYKTALKITWLAPKCPKNQLYADRFCPKLPKLPKKTTYSIKYFLYFQKIILLFFALIPFIQSYRILFLVPFPAPSHWIWLRHFSEELIQRGHEVCDNIQLENLNKKKIVNIYNYNTYCLGYSNNQLPHVISAFKLHRGHN